MEDEIVIFKTDDESVNVEVRFEDETAWLTQNQKSTLFGKSKSTINEHIKNIFEEGKLEEKVVVRKFRIISVGYRVKSLRGTRFRRWRLLASSWIL